MNKIPLTQNQKNALNIDLHTLVEAGAGAGKTMVLVQRFLRVLYKKPSIKPEHILAITFTEKAASEMVQRITTYLKSDTNPSSNSYQRNQHILSQLHTANIQTIHSFCAKLIRQFPVECKIDPNFKVIQEEVRRYYWQQSVEQTLAEYSTSASNELIDLLTHMPLYRYRALLVDLGKYAARSSALTDQSQQAFIQATCSDLNEDDQFILIKTMTYETKLLSGLQRALHHYNCWKKSESVLDFDDLITLTQELLENKLTARVIQKQYPYILVDEFQDTDDSQWNIIKSISMFSESTGPVSNLFLVGDIKQSIYSFRGAKPEQFKWLGDWFKSSPNSQYVQLNDNFRSNTAIINFINERFQHIFENSSIIDFNHLVANADEQGSVQINDQNDEWHTIIEWIHARLNHYNLKDIAILSRTKKPLETLQRRLTEANIPATIQSGQQLKHYEEVTATITLILSLLDPSNNAHIIGLMRSIFFNISDTCIYKLVHQQCHPSMIQELEALNIKKWMKTLDKTVQLEEAALLFAQEKIQKWIQLIDWLPLDSLIDLAFEEANIMLKLHINGKKEKEVAILKQFKQDTMTFCRTHSLTKTALLNYLKRVVHHPIKIQKQSEENSIKLMTIHSAKGLEFPCVIIPHCHKPFSKKPPSSFTWIDSYGICLSKHPEDTSLPNPLYTQHMKNRSILEFEEEKRIFYVATTRAKNHLLFTATPSSNKTEQESFKCYLDLVNFNATTSSIQPFIPTQMTPPINAPPTHATSMSFELPNSRKRLFQTKMMVPPAQIVTPSEVIRHLRSNESTQSIGTKKRKPSHLKSAVVGIALHKAVELFFNNGLPISEIVKTCQNLVSSDDQKLSLSALLNDVLKDISNTPIATDIQSASHAWFEKAFIMKQAPFIIQGRMDMLLENKNTIHIIDLKSDQNLPENMVENHPYRLQLLVYAQAARLMFPSKTISTQLYFIRHKKKVTINFTSEDHSKFENQLANLAIIA